MKIAIFDQIVFSHLKCDLISVRRCR